MGNGTPEKSRILSLASYLSTQKTMTSTRKNTNTKYKCVFLGEQSVGKTSLITRYMYDSFDPQYCATIGIDFLAKTINNIPNTRPIKTQLWDTAGQERFRSLIPSYIRDANVAIIVYDITKAATFESVDRWVAEVRNERGDGTIICLVGNKCDLGDERVVSKEQGQGKADELNLLFIETSAKTCENVGEMFTTFGKAISTSTFDNDPYASQEKKDIASCKRKSDVFFIYIFFYYIVTIVDPSRDVKPKQSRWWCFF